MLHLFRKQSFLQTKRNLQKNINWTFSIMPYFLWKLELISSGSSKIVSGNHLLKFFLAILLTLRSLTLFYPIIRANTILDKINGTNIKFSQIFSSTLSLPPPELHVAFERHFFSKICLILRSRLGEWGLKL